jgi:hypothetical protein
MAGQFVMHQVQQIPFSNVIQIVEVLHDTNDRFNGMDKRRGHHQFVDEEKSKLVIELPGSSSVHVVNRLLGTWGLGVCVS